MIRKQSHMVKVKVYRNDSPENIHAFDKLLCFLQY